MFFLQLRNELRKLFGKKRTYIGFGVFLVFENLVLLVFHFKAEKSMGQLLTLNGYDFKQYISALTVAIAMLIPQILMLVPLYVTLVGGDIVAKEAEDGTLRMILSRPISRFRLLFVKWLTGIIFSFVLVAALGAMALFFARLWFPWGGMFFSFPVPLQIFSVMSPGEGLKLYMLSHVFMAASAAATFSIAFMFSCFNMKPAAATILAMTFVILSLVAEALPSFEDYREWLLTYHYKSSFLVFAEPVQISRMVQSFTIVAAFAVIAFIIGAAGFHTRDIKS